MAFWIVVWIAAVLLAEGWRQARRLLREMNDAIERA